MCRTFANVAPPLNRTLTNAIKLPGKRRGGHGCAPLSILHLSVYLFMTEDALLNTTMTALVTVGDATATAIAINANMIAYSTMVTPFVLCFFCITVPRLMGNGVGRSLAGGKILRTYAAEHSSQFSDASLKNRAKS